MQKWPALWFLVNTPLCICYRCKSYLQILKTTKYQLSNNAYFVNKFFGEQSLLFEFLHS